MTTPADQRPTATLIGTEARPGVTHSALLLAAIAGGRKGLPNISAREAVQLAALAAPGLVAFNLLVLGAAPPRAGLARPPARPQGAHLHWWSRQIPSSFECGCNSCGESPLAMPRPSAQQAA